MTAVGWLPASAEELFGPEATAEESYEVLTVDVTPTGWTEALQVARDELGCTYFDWLSAVDEPGTGLRVSAHVVALSPVRRLLVRTTVPHEAPVLPSAVDVYAGAAWHERETHEMFGITFEGHPALEHLLLPEGFEGHPLRKDFVLAARVAKAWPGAKEPGESTASHGGSAAGGGPKRRQMLPPGVPDPNEWGPLKGQLPPAPARPARAAGRAAGERPVRRPRTAAEGSASQAPAAGEPTETAAPPRRARSTPEGSASQRAAEDTAPTAPAAPRRARSVSEGSASQRAAEDTAPTAPAAPRSARSASEVSASQRAEGGAEPAAPSTGPRRARSASEGSASQRAEGPAAEDTPRRPAPAPRSADAPWHHARPAFDEPEPAAPEGPEKPTTEPAEPATEPADSTSPATEPASPAPHAAEADTAPAAEPDATGGEAHRGETRPGDTRPDGAQQQTPNSPKKSSNPDDPPGGTQ
ncbi:NADH-quinone oxidoreductase subunit C [Streptomyces sp. NPDC051104]|uniref:NADH-quinone oxidoreductase subunit C n=1 Tax=Streptomyces sp. NPDC051104 TaxID=3155044 RepID=UPI003442E578